MGGISYSRLVAAVSEAGGIGTFGAAPLEAGRLVAGIGEVHRRTD
ncbi:MAG: nitronate monooxygenase [Actinomycetota bacterium]